EVPERGATCLERYSKMLRYHTLLTLWTGRRAKSAEHRHCYTGRIFGSTFAADGRSLPLFPRVEGGEGGSVSSPPPTRARRGRERPSAANVEPEMPTSLVQCLH